MSVKKSISRRSFLRMAAVSSAAALAACGGGAQPTAAPSGEKEEAPKGEAPAGEKISLRMWSHQNPSFVAANEAVIAKYIEANPNVEIKYENFDYADFITTIQTAMAAKNEADIIEMFGSWVQSYAKGGTLAAVSEAVMGLEKARDLFYAAPIDGYVWEGKLFGFPSEYNLENGAVLTNKRMFEEQGITFPPAYASWEEVVNDAKKMTKVEDGNMTVAGFHYINGDGLGFLLWENILSNGGNYFADDKIHLNFLTPQAEAAVQWFYDMANVDKVVDPMTFNPDSNWVGESFFQGLVAIGFIGPWIVPEGRRNYPDFADPWDYVATPKFAETRKFAADAGWGKVVSPNSKNVDEAWKYSLFATTDNAIAKQWNASTGTIPALKAVAEDPNLLNDINWIGPSLKVLPEGQFVGDLQDRDYVWYDVVATHITECLQGARSVQETLQLMTDEANAMIDSKIKK